MPKALPALVGVLSIVLVFVAGCPPPEECALGAEGCACTEGGACDDGLVCLSALCVDAAGDGDGDDGDGDGGVTGDGDGDGDGDACGLPLCMTLATVPAYDVSSNGSLVPLDDARVFFVGDLEGEVNHTSVGVTDGTSAGTRILFDDVSPFPYEPVVYNGTVVAGWNKDDAGAAFYGIDPDSGESEALTPLGDSPRQAYAASQGIVLRTDDGVYVTDGTAQGTELLFPTLAGELDYDDSPLFPAGPAVAFFIQNEATDVVTLYVSTGAASPTALGEVPTSSGVMPGLGTDSAAFLDDGSFLFYWNQSGERQLWSASTSQAPQRIAAPAIFQEGQGRPTDFTASGPYLFFTKSLDGTRRLYRTDGTDAGTVEVYAPQGGAGVVNEDALGVLPAPHNLVPDGQGGVWFRAEDADGARAGLWRTSGAGASAVASGPPPEGAPEQEHNGSGPMRVIGGRLYAAGHPYTVEVDDAGHRRIGNPQNPTGGYSTGVRHIVGTGERVWFGSSHGLTYLDRSVTNGGDGDGDGDGDTSTSFAVVTANGTPIGYLVNVDEHRFKIYDDVNGVIFYVNPTTGYVTGYLPSTVYELPDCAGDAYLVKASGSQCPDEPDPPTHVILAVDGDTLGYSEPTALYDVSDSSAATVTTIDSSLDREGVCRPYEETGGQSACVVPVPYTTVIPPTFATPIEVSDGLP